MKHEAKALSAGSTSATARHGRSLLCVLALSLCALALTAAPALAGEATTPVLSNPSYASVHVEAEADVGGFGTYEIQYSTDQTTWVTGYEKFTFEPGLIPFQADLTHLKGGTTYFVRTVANDFSVGQALSPEPNPEFTTLPVDPPSVVSIEDAANTQYTVADVKGKVKRPAGNADPAFDVECNFEYVSDDNFNATGFEAATKAPCDPPNPITAEGESDVATKLTGLAMGTTYHLRLTGENAGGSDSKVAADTFTTLSSPPAPTVTIDPVTTFTDASAHLSGKVNPNGTDPALDSAWHFECVPACGEPGGTVVADGSEHVVEADISGLEPNTSYEVKLVATNAGGPGEADTAFKTALLAPLAQTGFASEVEAGAATLNGKVNPHNSEVTYSFEYGLDESYGAATPVTSLGAIDNVRHDVSQSVEGLAPEATYHFRLTATNAEAQPPETTHGEDHTFTTPPASGPKACPNEQLRAENNSLALPDCRAYELVSPIKKNGNLAGAGGAGSPKYSYVRTDGDGILYGVTGPQGTPHRGVQAFAVGRRGPDGWSARDAIPGGTRDRIYLRSYQVFAPTPSDDLTTLLFDSPGSWVPQYPDSGGSGGLYFAREDGAIEWLSEPQIADPEPPLGSYSASWFQPVGASPDLGTTYFWARPTLLRADDARLPGGWGMYEYSNGQLKPAGTLPDGTEPSGGSAPASSSEFYRDNNNFINADKTSHEVSDDGATLFFVSPDPGTITEPGETTIQLYVRRDGHSTLVSHTQAGPDVQAPGGVSPAGNLGQAQEAPYPRQFGFGSADGSHAIFRSVSALAPGAPADSSIKAYRYDVASNTLTYLPGVGGSIVAASDDDSRFLFAGGGIKLWDNGVVKTIASAQGSYMRPARATASGSVFLFSTDAPIPGFNSGNSGPFDHIAQVYRYDVDHGQLSCVSCPPDGYAPNSNAALSTVDSAAVSTPPTGSLLGPRGMSADGKRVFFDTADSLLPQDTNGRRDVYEWTPEGLFLISSGQSDTDSYGLGSSADGENVFFTTTEGLDPRDTDGTFDVYDARVNGGYAQAAAVSPCTENNTCKKASPVPPNRPGPATNSFSSPGTPAPCPKGKVRKHGKCVKKPPKRLKHHKKSQKRAGHKRGGSK